MASLRDTDYKGKVSSSGAIFPGEIAIKRGFTPVGD
jgi:hypothetical protein